MTMPKHSQAGSKKADRLLKLHVQAESYKTQLSSEWNEIACYVRPSKSIFNEGTNAVKLNSTDDLFDTSAIQALQTYSSGCMEWMTPSNKDWFALSPPDELKDNDTVKSWYSECTDVLKKALLDSNFYEVALNCYLDDGSFGTSGFMLDGDEFGNLEFEKFKVNSFSITENVKGEVDTVFRELNLTARQAAQKFGEENLHGDILERLRNDDDTKFCFVHIIMPRSDSDRIMGRMDGENMPWASIYIDKKHRDIVLESGTWENPAIVHRHDTRTNSPFGYSPGMQALPDIRQINNVQECLDTLVEVAVTPPVLVHNDHEGEVDLMAGGVTYYKDDKNKPQFWQSGGNYPIGEDRVQSRRDAIDAAFFVRLFQSLSGRREGKQMTAYEVGVIQEEQLTLFSPTFMKKSKEINIPTLKRAFGILLRAGRLPEIPQGLVQMGRDGVPFLPDPKIVFTSRMALAMEALQTGAFTRTVGILGQIIELKPEVFDHFDFDSISRAIGRNNGMPEAWLKPQRDVDLMRQQRAQQEQDMIDRENATQEAGAAAQLASSGLIGQRAA